MVCRMNGMTWRRLLCFLALIAPVLATGRDPDLKPGFPIQVYHDGYLGWVTQGVHTLVGNIDGDPNPEILRTGMPGPLHAWNHDGSPVGGWPRTSGPGMALPVLAELVGGQPPLEVAGANVWGPSHLSAWRGDGTPIGGWPVTVANSPSDPPAACDIDGDGLDEVFLGEEDWKLH